jgi:hypothetical protein
VLVCVVLQRQDLSGPSGSCRVSVSAMRRQKCTGALYSRGASAFSNHLHSVHANSIHERIPMTVFGGGKDPREKRENIRCGTTFIVITSISDVPSCIFRTTKTHVIVHLYPKFPSIIVSWA